MACGPAWVTLEASGFTPLTGFKNKSSLDVGAHASKETVECGKSSRSCPWIAADSSHTHSTVGAARGTLEKRGDHSGSKANVQA